jgi:dihydrofolate synthase/folylpolyglutamate synthase
MDALSNWEERPRRRMRPSLDPIRDLLERLGDPHADLGGVHVAGSKGKGSLSGLVAAGLEAAGLRTGVYASPHVERMTERVRVGGREVADEALAEALEQVLDTRAAATAAGTPGVEATWFDTVTAAAFLVFERAGVDLIVAECGLGGRLDSTNVLSPEVCAITGIELEHTVVLGDTRALIAAEKAGILKPGVTLVTPLGEDDEAGAVIAARARELCVQVLRPPAIEGWSALPFERRNRALAGLVLEELGRRGHPVGAGVLSDEVVRAGRLPGRMERFSSGGVPVVLDGAHTPASVDGCLRELEADPGLHGRPQVILGLAAEKDLEGILKTLVGRVDRVLCTSVGGALHRTPEQIESAARALGMVTETAAPPRVALERALVAAPRGGWVLAIGSLYLAGELRPLLRSDPSAPAP